ncbi:MAG: HD domain-containing protein [Desulfovibrio sp.]|nr:HD domain-containing protein [Desulfovibrio sp.]
MEKGCFVKDMSPAAEVQGLFAVAQAAQAQSRNGPYWRSTLSDASGSVEAKIWHPLSAEFHDISVGSLVWAEGRTALFREQMQLTLERMQILSEAEAARVDHAWLMPASPFDLDTMMGQLLSLCREEFRHKPWRKLVLAVLEDAQLQAAFRVCPAAKGVHHAYVGGLLEHTLGVFTLCRRIADQYTQLDRQALLAGALFHDLGKIREFSGGLANDYTDEGRLLGHIMLGVEMLTPFLARSGLEDELQRHLRHLILSHHGELQFGAVRPPHTAEALALHYADNLDAKMAQCRTLFEQLGNGSTWTPYQATLGRHMHRAMPTPQGPTPRERKKAVKEECLSLLKV